ncbi:hypothetical protein BDN72DRAFT_859697 [Pluteus cervinus]|uniref:Uncharacterized protein n=1 Tax=Pluteus cervinus TaxID=181527 RepID=A0ACD3AMF6_9AGAR|nr:hypothetical protein BDN72DRAFT_859697 [Pluteus cervinus]
MCPAGLEDDLVQWKETRLLARILIAGEVLDETGDYLPVIHEGAKSVAQWDLGSFQVPSECSPLNLAITTTRGFEIFNFQFGRLPNGIWRFGEYNESERIYGNFRIHAILYHPPKDFHMRYVATATSALTRVLPPQSLDAKVASPPWLLASLPAEQLLKVGTSHYGRFRTDRFQSGEKAHLNFALTAFERALEDPNINPPLSQVLEIMIPFLRCLRQGRSLCPNTAFEVLRTFPGLPNAVDAQVLLQWVVYDVASSFEWLDYAPLAIESVAGPLGALLRFAPLDDSLLFALHNWALLVSSLARDTKEVVPLTDLVDLLPDGDLRLDGSESLAIVRAAVYFQQAQNHGGPSLDATLRVAELAMQSLSGPDDSLDTKRAAASKFSSSFSGWFFWSYVHRGGLGAFAPHQDRLLCLTASQLSDLPLPPDIQSDLRLVRSKLTADTLDSWGLMNSLMPRPAILDDNDNEFIRESYSDLLRDEIRWTDMPAQYPKGAAEMVRLFLAETDSKQEPMVFIHAVTTARALRLPEALKLYELLMGLLEARQLGAEYLCSDQLKGIVGFSLIIRDAVSCASEMGNHALALQWSDQGRSKIWEWFFHSRSSIDQLHAIEPIIARKLKTRPGWIDSWTSTQRDDSNSSNSKKDEFISMFNGFLPLPGFDRFLRPKTPVEITSIAEALGGPIVYLNPNRYSSHALVVLPGLDDILHIPLSQVNYLGLRNLSAEFMKSHRTFLHEGFSPERKGMLVKPKPASPSPFRFPATKLLEQLWTGIVKPVLDGLGIQRAQTITADMPRIWWCPSGPLTGLPLHAAGVYQDDGQGPAISDYVVSSYFPSASALTYALRPENSSQKFSLLTIANPTGAGLPGTELELDKIKKHTITQELTYGEATVEKVKKGMEDASWVHFACHGVANPDQPMESALKLANHARLTLREIADMSLPHAEFAFLSACETAKGIAQAPDQSAHLSTGMLACGYRSIIGSLWQISDEYAPFVADRVYEKMLEGGQPDYKRAAYALHDAVQALRKEHKVPFATWLPFIHVGV